MPETVTMFKVLCIVELRSTYNSQSLRSPLMDDRKRTPPRQRPGLGGFPGKTNLSDRRGTRDSRDSREDK